MTAAGDGPVDRTGLQAERTQLAWIRTALATCALAAVATRLAATGSSAALAVVAGVAVVLPAFAGAWLRIRALQRQPVPRAAAPPAVALLAASLALADALALALLVA